MPCQQSNIGLDAMSPKCFSHMYFSCDRNGEMTDGPGILKKQSFIKVLNTNKH